MPELPWFDYQGENTQQLLAVADQYRADSLLCAFDQALQAKERNGIALTNEERVVVAVEALQREVNNGGFHQFFTSASRVYAPIIVKCLARIGAHDVADMTAAALDSLQLTELSPDAVYEAAEQALMENDEEVMETLEACDQQLYDVMDLDDKLFAFVRANAARINLR